MKLELYYYDQCPFCQRVLGAIKSLSLEECISMKNTFTDSQNAQFHKQKTGRSTVPCLYIDGSPLFESLDIINWLEANQSKIKA